MEMRAGRPASWDPRLELELCQELAIVSIIPLTSGKASGCILPVSEIEVRLNSKAALALI